MTAPRSNFTVPTTSGWLVFSSGGTYQTAKFNGRTFISALEHALRTAPQLARPVRTFDGTMVSGSDVREGDGQWGPTVYRAMWALASSRGAPSTELRNIQLSAQAHTLTLSIMTIAAYIVLTSLGHASPNPRIPANSLLPRYLQVLPGINTIIDIVDSTPDELAAVGVTAPAPSPVPDGRGTTGGVPNTGTPAPGTSTDPATGLPAKSDSGAGPDSGTGEKTATDESGVRLPTGQPDTAITSHGVSWGPILAVGGAIAALGLLVYSVSQSSPMELPRHNPSRIHLSHGLIERLSQWHGGQNDPIYSLSSTGGGTSETISDALYNLRKSRASVVAQIDRHRRDGRHIWQREAEKSLRHLDVTIGMLERAAAA